MPAKQLPGLDRPMLVPRGVLALQRFSDAVQADSRHPYASAHSQALCAPSPDCRKPYERVFDAIELVAAQRRRPRRYPIMRNQLAFYKPQDGNQAGPLFAFEDRATGVTLATCRGVLHHVMGEAQKFALAQGLTLADLFVRIADDDAPVL